MRRSQDFVWLWGALFSLSPSKYGLNIPPDLTHPAKNVLKLTLALAGGALRVLGVHLHIFSVNYA